jgi:hypothetical protein
VKGVSGYRGKIEVGREKKIVQQIDKEIKGRMGIKNSG